MSTTESIPVASGPLTDIVCATAGTKAEKVVRLMQKIHETDALKPEGERKYSCSLSFMFLEAGEPKHGLFLEDSSRHGETFSLAYTQGADGVYIAPVGSNLRVEEGSCRLKDAALQFLAMIERGIGVWTDSLGGESRTAYGCASNPEAGKKRKERRRMNRGRSARDRMSRIWS